MAKKRKKAGLVDRLPNRLRKVVAWAAAATTLVYETVDLPMGIRAGLGMLISRVDIEPRTPPIASGGQSTFSLAFQIRAGEKTTMAAGDDASVICQIQLQGLQTTSGGNILYWPVTWGGPVLVADRHLTFLMDAGADIAPWQSLDMLFTVWYTWVPVGTQEYIEIKEAEGVLE